MLDGRDPEDMVQEFMADRIKPLTAMLLAQATDDDSFGRLVRRSVLNWMIDQARKTGVGALRRTIETLLAQSPEFEKVPPGHEGAGRWRIADSGSAPWGGDLGRLIVVAWAVPNVRVPKSSGRSRRPPVADRASLVAIALAVLSDAGGSLEIGQFVYVFSKRFAAALDPVVVSLEDLGFHDDDLDEDDVGIDIPSESDGPEELVIAESVAEDVATAAKEIVERLSDSERALLPVLDDAAAVRARLGLGKSQSALITRALKCKIRDLAGTGDERHDIVREVIASCGDPDPT